MLAWRLLSYNTYQWFQQKASQAVQASERAASGSDWSQIATARAEDKSKLAVRYAHELATLKKQAFPHNEGQFFLVVVDDGEEWDLGPGDDSFSDGGKANQFELDAYRRRVTAFTPEPLTDDSGTYFAAYTPIVRAGTTVGLVGAQYDSAPLRDFQSVVQRAFLSSLTPTVIILSLAVAWVLGQTFGEPTDILREIEETARAERSRTLVDDKDDLWQRLSPREKEMAGHLRRGCETYQELADAMGIKTSTIGDYLTRVKEKTGWSKQRLAVMAQARRNLSLDPP